MDVVYECRFHMKIARIIFLQILIKLQTAIGLA